MHQARAHYLPSATKPVYFSLTDLLFSRRRIAWVAVDFVLIILAFQIGIWLSPFGMWRIWEQPYLVAGTAFALSFCFMGTGIGYYDRVRRFSISNTIGTGFLMSFVSSMIAIGTLYFFFYGVFGRWTILYGAGVAYLVTISVRLPLRWALEHYPYRFTVFGSSPLLYDIQRHAQSTVPHAKLLNFVPWSDIFPREQPWSLARLLDAKVADIVVARDGFNDADFVDFALHAMHGGCRVVDEVVFYGHVFERVPIHQITKGWLLSEGLDQRRRAFSEVLKRIFDLFASALGLVVVLPLLLIIALAIRLSSAGPVIFVQERVGRFNKPFRMFKFRTMAVPKSGGDNVSGGFTAVSDPRVTWVGRLIRPLHFDELPQLFNILLGHMSLVGPRPEALKFASRIRGSVPLYDMRYLVRPGLTGHAQLNQGYAMDSVEDTEVKLSYDLYYVCNHSLTWDIRLMLRTVFVLMKGAR